MTEQLSTDVLICGAGAAGLTLAIDLARRGVAFRLVEKMNEPFRGSRGKGIQPRTQEIFKDLGILDRIVAAGGDYPKERLYRSDGSYVDSRITEHVDPTPSEPFQQPLMVPQFLTEAILRERLAEFGHWPEYGTEVIGLEQDGDGVTASLQRKGVTEHLRARWLVGADGGRSFVRHSLQVGFPGKTLGVRAIVADVALTGLSRDAWHRFGDGDMSRQIFLCPLAGTDMFQIQGPIPMEGDIDLSATGLGQLVAERTGRDDIHIHDVSWASAYTMNARLADQYRVGQVMLIGDAAHIHPPTGGQGLNTSVQDAYNLGWKIAAVIDGAPEVLLDSYEEERRPIAAEMLGLATRLLHTQHRDGIRRGREVKQLDIAYSGSSLALEVPARNGELFAGDRAPDAHLLGASGQPRHLFDLLQGPHWTLIGYQVAHRDGVPPRRGLHIHTFGTRGDVIDAHGHFRAAYDVEEGSWVLIRPDGYIGAIVEEASTELLEDYLTRAGLPATSATPATH
ncbi:MAG: FAD-dependent oxidoreductase [Herbaspirillum sp.]|nr:FAD-dependent oxidoreductase [Herbaspirillum sp.]